MQLFGNSCIILLLLSVVDISLSDVMIGESALQKSKHCIETATEAYNLMTGGVEESAIIEVTAHLETLAEDGKYLQKKAAGFLAKLQAQEEDLGSTLQLLQKEKQQLEKEIQAQRNRKADKEKDYSAKGSLLTDVDKFLHQAQIDAQNAENELQHAKKKLKKKKKGIFGKLKSGLGKLVGHVSSAEKRLKTAKSNLARRKAELSSAKSAADAARAALSEVDSKIKQQESMIQQIQQKVNKKQEEISFVKRSIVLLRQSTNFWELFVVAAVNAEERVQALQHVMNLAALEKDYDILRQDGTITKAKSFIEAWEVLATDQRLN